MKSLHINTEGPLIERKVHFKLTPDLCKPLFIGQHVSVSRIARMILFDTGFRLRPSDDAMMSIINTLRAGSLEPSDLTWSN
jgi:hypothetical protein